jgi:glycosyltransferase involved in cell wall biosynthesis
MFVRNKVTDDWTVDSIGSPMSRRVLRMLSIATARIERLQRTENQVIHSANLLPTRVSRGLGHAGPDIVNLHWIGTDTMSIVDIARCQQPVVMTLHDMWAFCGAEHYAPTSSDARWRAGYTRANRAAGQRGLDLDRWTWRRKRRHWRSMSVVCPSEWLATCVRESELMADWPTHVVPNPLDLEMFQPADRAFARQTLGLPPERRIILFGAIGGTKDPRKGWGLLHDALQVLSTQMPGLLGVIVGESQPKETLRAGIPLRWLGPLCDDASLALLYSAANVVVVPSRQEVLPQSGTEPQACGTPVVAFDAAGLPDVVAHGETGYLAQPYDAVDLARGITWVLEDDARYAQLRLAARARALRLWSAKLIAELYLDIYQATVERSAAAQRIQS